MAKPKVVKHDGVAVLADGYQLRRVQTANVSVDLSTEDVSELSNNEFVEQIKNTPVVSISIDTNEYGHVDTLASFANMSPGSNDAVVTLEDLKDSAVDFTFPVKEDGSIARTMHIGNAQLDSVSLSYDVGGVAGENYSLSADNKTWYLNTQKEVYVTSGTYASSSTFTTPIIDTDYIAIKATVNENNDVTVSSWEDYTGTVSGVTLESDDRIRLLYYPSGSVGFPDLATTGTGIGGLKKGQIDAYLYDSTEATPSTRTLRLQTVNIDVDFGREVLEELGNHRAFERSVVSPIPVDVSVSFLDTDLESFAEFTGNGTDFASVNSMSVDDLISNITLEVKTYSSTSTKDATTLLRTITVSGLSVVSEGHETSVGGKSAQNYSFRSSNMTISGSGLLKL